MKSLIEKMRPYSDYFNLVTQFDKIDNPTQEFWFSQWVAEALALGIILHYVPEEEMDSFQLFDGLSYKWYEDVIMYEGTSREEDRRNFYTDKLLGTTKYTPDGVIIWNPEVKNILFNDLFEKGNCYFKAQFIEEKWVSIFDVKAPKGVNRASDIPFSFTRKWMWQRFNLFVNKVMCIPPKPLDKGYLFKETWTPQRYLLTDKMTKQRTIHYPIKNALENLKI